jgi:hypothetical protein
LAVSKKNAKTPDETRKFPKGKLEIVRVGDFTIGRGTYYAGWKWSECVKPIAKTESCQAHHVGYVVSGQMAGVMDDGTKWKVGAGDMIDLPSGHDAWVVGRRSVVLIDFTGAPNVAKTK